MLVRDTPDGVEVFMLQRTHSAVFANGQYVFPGGKVDDADHAAELEPYCDTTDTVASARMGMASGGLAWLVAAVRECFEEAGVLLARPAGSGDLISFDDADVASRFNEARRLVHDGSRSMIELCQAEDLVISVDDVVLVDHWVTPIGEPRRFDTRFFVALAPPEQTPLHDDVETITSLWVRPDDALQMWQAGELQMLPPTVVSLRFLAAHATTADVMAASRAVGVPPVIEPRLVLNEAGQMTGVLNPGDLGFDDLPIPETIINKG